MFNHFSFATITLWWQSVCARFTHLTGNVLGNLKSQVPFNLTLSRVAPSAVSKGGGGLIGPPQVSKGVGVVSVSNFSCNLRSDHD